MQGVVEQMKLLVMTLASHIRVQVKVPVTRLSVQLLANTLGKAGHGPNTWTPDIHKKNWMEYWFLALTRTRLGYCDHLGSETGDGISFFQINIFLK